MLSAVYQDAADAAVQSRLAHSLLFEGQKKKTTGAGSQVQQQ